MALQDRGKKQSIVLLIVGVIVCNVALFLVLLVPSRQTGSSPPPDRQAHILDGYAKLPIRFEANEGQTDPEVKFLARGGGYNLYLTSAEAVVTLTRRKPQDPRPTRGARLPIPATPAGTALIRMHLTDSNPHPEISRSEELPGTTNYFIGNDPKAWRTNIKSYGRIRYSGVYPGIDLVYHGNQQQLEYDIEIAPEADPNAVEMSFDGADALDMNREGQLVLHTSTGDIVQRRPVAYQETGAGRREVPVSYLLAAGPRVRFQLGAYDIHQAVVIDPVLTYSTYLGGSGGDFGDQGLGIAVDSSGNAYITGWTTSTNFPTANAFQGSLAGRNGNAFVTKLNGSGSALVYSTYLGGNGFFGDQGLGIAVDSSGNAYITGWTTSTNFPTANAFQRSYAGSAGSGNAFVTKLNGSGSALVYSTYLGGNGFGTPGDTGYGIAVDSSGNAYITGSTNSTNFPTVNAFQLSHAGRSGTLNAFVAKLNGSGSALVYSTYLGGNGGESVGDIGYGIAVDSSGNAYVTGSTTSTNFPTANAFQRSYAGSAGSRNAFVTKLDGSGSALVYSTYLGGNGGDEGHGIAVDSSGNAYITGVTASTNFPTANAFQRSRDGNVGSRNAFVTKLNGSGSALVYSTYLGGNRDDMGSGIAVDSNGNAYITGFTSSTNFPTANAFQGSLTGSYSAFVTKLNGPGSALVYSAYLGGNRGGSSDGIAVDSSGNAYITGWTTSTNFPTANAIQSSNAGGSLGNAFVAKISDTSGGTTVNPPFSFMDRGGVSLSTDGVMVGNTPSAYSLIQPASGNTAPSGLAIFDYRPNGILLSETAVPATPTLMSGLMYAQIGNGVDAGLAIANPNNSAATINFTFTNTSGTNVITNSTTIGANSQLGVFLDQSPYNAPSSFEGAFSFTSSVPVGAVALRSLINQRGDFLISTLPVIDTTTPPNTGTVVVPHFSDGAGWTTQIFLVNPTNTAMTGNVQFAMDNPAAAVTIAGQTATAFPYSVAPGSSFKIATAGANAATQSGSVHIVPSGGGIAPTPLVTFSYTPAGITVSEAGVSATAGTAFRMYVELAGTSGLSGNIDSGIAIANNGSAAASVTLSLTELSGNAVGGPVTITVPASGHTGQFLEQFFAGQTLPNPFKGVLRISTTSSAGISVVGLRARYNERQPMPDLLITTTPPTVETAAPSSAKLLFPGFANGEGYTTQFILFSGNAGQSSSGTMQFFSNAGTPLSLPLH